MNTQLKQHLYSSLFGYTFLNQITKRLPSFALCFLENSSPMSLCGPLQRLFDTDSLG